MAETIPPEWLCIDRYKDVRSCRLRDENRGCNPGIFDYKYLGFTDEPRKKQHRLDWSSAALVEEFIRMAHKTTYETLARYYCISRDVAFRKYKEFELQGLCGPKGSGIVRRDNVLRTDKES